jgi:hypothetical protein
VSAGKDPVSIKKGRVSPRPFLHARSAHKRYLVRPRKRSVSDSRKQLQRRGVSCSLPPLLKAEQRPERASQAVHRFGCVRSNVPCRAICGMPLSEGLYTGRHSEPCTAAAATATFRRVSAPRSPFRPSPAEPPFGIGFQRRRSSCSCEQWKAGQSDGFHLCRRRRSCPEERRGSGDEIAHNTTCSYDPECTGRPRQRSANLGSRRSPRDRWQLEVEKAARWQPMYQAEQLG